MQKHNKYDTFLSMELTILFTLEPLLVCSHSHGRTVPCLLVGFESLDYGSYSFSVILVTSYALSRIRIAGLFQRIFLITA